MNPTPPPTPTNAPPTAAQAVIDRHDRYMSINYGRYPIVVDHGHGSRFVDTRGKTYLDLFPGFGGGLLGHCPADLVDAVTEQAKKLWHVGNLFHTEPQTRLAEAIALRGFGGRSFFCHSGADANEAALKLTRLYGHANPGTQGPRFKVITTHRSFHGRSFATMVATGQERVRKGFEPLLGGFTHVPFDDAQAVADAVDHQTVAVMVEPIQGEGGVNVPDDGYLPALRELCDRRDLLLICDEVWTGGGRTGRYFAHQHWGVEPDIMTLAKGVGGGLPVGVMCAQPRVAELYDHRVHGGVAHATTLGGNCLAMAVGAKIFEVLERDRLVEHAERLGAEALARLSQLIGRAPEVKAVRGRGLFIGIEIDAKATGGRFTQARDIVNRCLELGVLINATQGNVVRIAPAVNITAEELGRGLDVLEQVLVG